MSLITILLLILMAAGATLGRWLPENTVITRLADLLLRISIFALLFLLGIEIGGNDAVFSNLETIGLEAAAIGVVIGRLDRVPDILVNPGLSVWTLYVLIFVVGIVVGLDRRVPASLRSTGWRIVIVPAAAIVGTAGGVLVIAPFLSVAFNHTLAVGFGLGYYSLSSILIGQIAGDRLALVALLANIFRELITVIGAPVACPALRTFCPYTGRWRHHDGHHAAVERVFVGPRLCSDRGFNSAALTVLVPVLVTLALSV